jgi:DNA (cytosine-5)-methyltransferase 1
MKFIDFFAGIGGFRMGMEQAGHECVGFCEFDKYAVMSYTAMHLATEEQRRYLDTLDLRARQKEILKDEYKNGEWYANDVRTVDARSMPDAECWCFGFPCQDISVAGAQLGFDGKRSSLFFEVMRLLDEREKDGLSRPRYLFIENVKNLLSVNDGFDFAKVLSALDERGYDAEWSVLDSQNFGVPQHRERVFIIGHLRGCGGSEVFPLEATDGKNCVYQIGMDGTSKRKNPNQYRLYDVSGLCPTLNKMDGGGREPDIPVIIKKKA